jgi:cytochrome P450
VIIAIWCVHRHEKLWDEPNGFYPDRFASEKVKARHRCAYMPFGAGPRICIGSNFAMLEMTTILATLVRGFRFKPAPGHRVALPSHLTLRAKMACRLLLKSCER